MSHLVVAKGYGEKDCGTCSYYVDNLFCLSYNEDIFQNEDRIPLRCEECIEQEKKQRPVLFDDRGDPIIE